MKMKRWIGVVIFTALIVLVVGLTVYNVGNNSAQNAPRAVTNTTNTTTVNQTLPSVQQQAIFLDYEGDLR